MNRTPRVRHRRGRGTPSRRQRLGIEDGRSALGFNTRKETSKIRWSPVKVYYVETTQPTVDN